MSQTKSVTLCRFFFRVQGLPNRILREIASVSSIFFKYNVGIVFISFDKSCQKCYNPFLFEGLGSFSGMGLLLTVSWRLVNDFIQCW